MTRLLALPRRAGILSRQPGRGGRLPGMSGTQPLVAPAVNPATM